MSEAMLLIFLWIVWFGFGGWCIRERRPWTGIPLGLAMMTGWAILTITMKGIIHN